MRLTLSLGLVSLALAGLTGCDIEDFGPSNRFKEDFAETRAFPAGGQLSLESFNGSVEVTGWDRDSVEITGTKHASTEDMLKLIDLDINVSGGVARIRAIRPSERRGNLGVSFAIHVPRRTNLDRIVSSNGAIRINDIEGAARLRTSNGAIRIVALKGDVEAQTSNGSVDLQDSTGAAIIRTSNGSVKAEAVRGAFQATTSNSRIHARVIDPAPQHPIRVETSNGSVDLTIETFKNNDIHATTSNSSITLRLPPTVNAKLDANTSNSSIQTDFTISPVGGRMSKTHVEGPIGSGGSLIELQTSNGGIKVLKNAGS